MSTRGSSRGGRGRGSNRGRGVGYNRSFSSSTGSGAISGPSQSIPGGIPTGSISKLKSQLRQTRRLLARDDLNADVRTTSERRLQTLESELVKAERSELEKKMVTKYRGIRFFERQKLLRKIKQLKKTLEEAKAQDEDSEKSLLAARVDLAYVLHYPKTQKYVSLFPEGNHVAFSIEKEPAADAPAAERTRYDLRLKIRNAMADQRVGDAVEEGEMALASSLDEDASIDGEQPSGMVVAGSKRSRDDRTAEEKDTVHKKSRPSSAMATVAAAAPPVVVAAGSAAANSNGAALQSESAAAGGANDGVKSNKKLKKDAKDAKRRAKKLAEAQAAAAAAGAGVADGGAAPAPGSGQSKETAPRSGAGEVIAEPEAVKTGLAAEDDFFA